MNNGIEYICLFEGGFYKFISDDFEICFGQIAVRSEMKKSPVEISIGEAGEQKRAM